MKNTQSWHLVKPIIPEALKYIQLFTIPHIQKNALRDTWQNGGQIRFYSILLLRHAAWNREKNLSISVSFPQIP